MKTLFIGYTRKVGSFTNEKTGELVEYSNRDLRFITDANPNTDVRGFSQFVEPKMKLAQLAQILKVPETDEAVDKALTALLNREVNLNYAPLGDKLSVVWFAPAEAITK